MENRSKLLDTIRPMLNIDFDRKIASDELVFQNDVLRPILKFQNILYVKIFLNELYSKNINFRNLNEKDLRVKINNMLLKEQQLKHKLLGICMGMFTVDELTFYLEHQKGINKRILAMLEERIVDNLSSNFLK